AGIQFGDIIVEFKGQPITNAHDLIVKVAGTPVVESAALVYLREVGGNLERRTANVTLGERPVNLNPRDENSVLGKSKAGTSGATPGGNLRLGITLAELTPQIIAAGNLAGVRGLFVKEIDPNGIVADIRQPNGGPALVDGDVITRINRMPVTTLAEFARIVDNLKPGDPVVLNIVRYDRRGERLVQRLAQFTYQ
ncbi:MAG: hypothetical protein H7Y30_00120, partial [Pyrinomonadaceae bacterium]|nr:hypothetical protein [Pyrinomonadaceae bacterium]